MNFYISYENINLLGEAQYLENEFSFFYEPWNNVDFSIVLGNSYSSLDVKLREKTVVQLTGFNSKDSWIKKTLCVPKASIGKLFVEADSVVWGPGMGVHYEESWNTYYNPDSGWICIGNSDYCEICRSVQFANNTIAVVKGTDLWAIWIKPRFV